MIASGIRAALLLLAAGGLAAGSQAASVLDWSLAHGTSNYDWSNGVAVDGLGSVYITGYTNGSLAAANPGGADAFVSKFDSAGNVLWSQQLGQLGTDVGNYVAADALGGVYIAGQTQNPLGGPVVGSTDAFLTRYSSSGSLLWTKQLGSAQDEGANGVTTDGLGNVYVTGSTQGSLAGPLLGQMDTFLYKYDAAGNLAWSRQFGSGVVTSGSAVSVDAGGNVYVSGGTWGNLGGPSAGMSDAFVRKYDSAGNALWSAQIGSSVHDTVQRMDVDAAGNVYVTGITNGNLAGPNAGFQDLFIAKYDASGALQWSQQLGGPGPDDGRGASVDPLGNIYFAGTTYDSLYGPNAGAGDLFVLQYDPAGNLLWSTQLGTSGDELATGLATDGLGVFYLTGITPDPPPNSFYFDGYLARFQPVPEPGGVALAAVAGVIGLAALRFRVRPRG